MEIKVGIKENEKNSIIHWAYKYFNKLISEPEFAFIIYEKTNWDISVKLVDENNMVVGLYLFGDRQIDSLVNTDRYKRLRGIEGVLLVIDDSIRGKGWGNKLKEYPKTLDFEYIWGEQLKTLNNLNDWLKRRVLVANLDEVYVTIEEFVK